jgi:hypothetical protein
MVLFIRIILSQQVLQYKIQAGHVECKENKPCKNITDDYP